MQQDPLDPYVEVLGCVDQDLTITVERIVNYGTDFGGCGSWVSPLQFNILFLGLALPLDRVGRLAYKWK